MNTAKITPDNFPGNMSNRQTMYCTRATEVLLCFSTVLSQMKFGIKQPLLKFMAEILSFFSFLENDNLFLSLQNFRNLFML